jgi:hypothetical protein
MSEAKPKFNGVFCSYPCRDLVPGKGARAAYEKAKCNRYGDDLVMAKGEVHRLERCKQCLADWGE